MGIYSDTNLMVSVKTLTAVKKRRFGNGRRAGGTACPTDVILPHIGRVSG
jgi:hypothetical protein